MHSATHRVYLTVLWLLLLTLVSVLMSAAVIFWRHWRSNSYMRRLPPIPTGLSDESAAKIAAKLGTLAKDQVALVLSGGGAKGAYEIGVWQALRHAGVGDFCAIAGTSVGALNAAMIAMDKLNAAQDLWLTLTPWKVLRLSGMRSARALVVRILLAPYFVIKYNSKWRGLLRPSVWEEYEYRFQNLKNDRLVLTIFAPYLAAWSVLWSGGWWPEGLALATLSIVCGLIRGDHGQTAQMWQMLRWLIVLPSALSVFVGFWRWLLLLDEKIAEKLPLASNEPLAQTLASHASDLCSSQQKARVIVTLATLRRVEMAPPDWRKSKRMALARPVAELGLSEEFTVGDQSLPLPVLPFRKQTRVEYVPYYFDLCRCGPDQIQGLILQSAGLPEIFASKVMSGAQYVDGGIADNTPLLPVLQTCEPSLVVVVYLEASARRIDVKKVLESLMCNIDTATPAFDDESLRQLAPRSSAAGILPPPIAVAQKPARDVLLLSIVPTRSLGGFLLGTLNFNASRAKALMTLGYWDTVRALEGGPQAAIL